MLAQHTRSTGLLCGRPVALELSTRQLERSGSWQGQLQTFAEDASIFTVLIEAFSILEIFRTIRSTNLLTYIHGPSVRPSGLFPSVRTTRLAILSRVPAEAKHRATKSLGA